MNNDPLSHEAQSRAVASGVFKGLFAFFILLPLAVGAIWFVLSSMSGMFDVGDGGRQNADPEAIRAKDAALAAKQADKQAQEKARQDAAEKSAREQAVQNLWTQRQWALVDGSAIVGSLSSIGPDKILVIAAAPPHSRLIWRTNLVESDQQLVSLSGH